ncbi:TPA: ead/Ea22-like family protein [Enterobacter cloacae]|nr:ead/Ea22-like family protein [Enterobacter cloacae]
MKFNKQELRKAAEKATEGNYVVGHCDINKHGNLSSVYVCQEWNGMAGGVVAECHVNCLTKNSDQVYANAGFMALASPANVISLLEEISTLESRCAELAAENAGLKEACGGDGSYRDCPACAHSEYIEAPETPATNAFLAEVRASAVDEACLKISNAIVNCYQDEQIGLDEAATICGDFASELRKGVQS